MWVRTHVDQWVLHPDVTLVDDAAVLPWAPPAGEADWRHFPMNETATPEESEDLGLGIGDEVFLPGLFVHHTGKEHNIPILRVGNIAAMPDEPVQTKIGLLDAYLVEARSIGGLSGSPVFVNPGLIRSHGNALKVGTNPNTYYLVGLMHGHFKVDISKLDAADTNGLSDEAINMGIAIVLPIGRVQDIIDSPELKGIRDAEDQREQSGQ
jgi:hypothetical protein